MKQCFDRLKIKQGCVSKGHSASGLHCRVDPGTHVLGNYSDGREKFCPEMLYVQLCTSGGYRLLLFVKVT